MMVNFIPHEAAAHDVQSLPVASPGKPIGRDEPLKAIYTHLKSNHAVLIRGAAGMGKTSLAATLAGAYAPQGGGVLWMDVKNSTLEELIVRIGRAYQVMEIMTSDTPLGMLGAAASTLTQHKPMLVLDGKISAQVANNFITKCAAGLPVLIVSEDALDGPWETIELTELESASAVIMFKQLAGLTDSSADAVVQEIVNLLGCSPYALAIGARGMLASKQPPAEYIKILHPAVDAAGGNGQLAALTTSYRALNGALQGLILMMGATFEGKASGELISMMSGATLDSIQSAMNILAQLYLVGRAQRYGGPYYGLHSITYTFAHNFLKSSNRLETLEAKVRSAVVDYARKYSADTPSAHNKLATEMDAFLALAAWEMREGSRELTNQLVTELTKAGDFASGRGYVYELLRLRGTFKPAFPAYDTPASIAELLRDDEDDEFDDDQYEDTFEDDEFLDELEEEEEEVEEIEEMQDVTASGDLTKLRAALAQARQQNNITQQIELLNAVGKAQINQQMENEAIATYGEVLTLYEERDDSSGVLETLDMLSSLMAKTENSQAAVLHAMRGIKLAEELDASEVHMHLLITLGDSRQQLGESEEAERAYSQALEIARNTGDSQNEALVLFKLGYAQLDNGDLRPAIETWEQALKLFKDQNKRDYEGRVLGALGTAYGELELWAEATNFYTSALHIAREVHDQEEEALQLGNLGYAAVQSQQLGQAVLRYRQALHLYYESKDRENIVSTIMDLTRLLAESPRHLSVAELLIDSALQLEANDKSVKQLKERITNEKMMAAANNVDFVVVTGTTQDYALNAYKLLDQ